MKVLVFLCVTLSALDRVSEHYFIVKMDCYRQRLNPVRTVIKPQVANIITKSNK